MGCSCVRDHVQSGDEVSLPLSGAKAAVDIREKYRIGKVLGSGAFGQVRECFLKDTMEPRAVKLMEKSVGSQGPWSNTAMFQREVLFLGQIRHENIIGIFDYYEDKIFLYAVLEKCQGGELFEQVVKRRRFTEVDASHFCGQILRALEHIHSMGIVHRDVKAENFLFVNKSENSPLKMIDFGMSERLQPGHYLSEVCGSPHYLAPDVINKHYDFRADIWAVGVLVYLMLYGRYPFDGPDTLSIVQDILWKKLDWDAGPPPRETKSYDNDIVDGCYRSAEARDFMSRLLERQTEDRLSATEALRHPWILRGSLPPPPPTTPHKNGESIPMEIIQAAQQKVTTSRNVESPAEESRRDQLLRQLEEEWNARSRNGRQQRDDLPREFSRRTQRIFTAPCRYVNHSFASELVAPVANAQNPYTISGPQASFSRSSRRAYTLQNVSQSPKANSGAANQSFSNR